MGHTKEEEAVRASDEDEGLRNHGYLEVDDHVHLVQVGLLVRGDTEAVLEEGSVNNDYEEDDGRQSLVETVCDGLFDVSSGVAKPKEDRR